MDDFAVGSQHRPTEAQLLLLTLLFVPLLFFVRFGYDYGASDQDDVLPQVMATADDHLFQSDWLVQTRLGSTNVRSAVVWMLAHGARLVPLWMVVFAAYAASWLLLCGGMYRLSLVLTGNRWAASAATLTALVLTPQWTLGANDLTSRLFIPSMPAWGLALLAIGAVLSNRPVAGGVAAGIATLLQPLIGLHTTALLLVVTLARRDSIRDATKLFLPLGLIGAVIILPLAIQQLSAPAGQSREAWTVLAHFRAPHHYLVGATSLGRGLRFGAVLLTGILLLGTGIGVEKERLRSARALFLAATLAVLASVVLADSFPAIGKLQLLKMSVFVKVFSITAAAGLAGWTASSLVRRIATLVGPPRSHSGDAHPSKASYARFADRAVVASLVLAAACYACVGLGLALNLRPVVARVLPVARAGTPSGAMENWIRHNTPVDATFAVPLSNTTFRVGTGRSIVVNHKSVPFRPDALLDWYRRVRDLSDPAETPSHPSRTLAETLRQLDSGYEALPPHRLAMLAADYGFDYVLKGSRLDTSGTGFQEVHREGPLRLYRLRPAIPAP